MLPFHTEVVWQFFNMFFDQLQPLYQDCQKKSFPHFLEDWQRSYVAYCRLFCQYHLLYLKTCFSSVTFLWFFLFNLLFIKGDWFAVTYLFFNGTCLSRVIFTDSFSILKGTFCWSGSFDESNSVSFNKGILAEVFELTIVNYRRLLFSIAHFHNCSTHLMKIW